MAARYHDVRRHAGPVPSDVTFCFVMAEADLACLRQQLSGEQLERRWVRDVA
jgi:hypothetical protein